MDTLRPMRTVIQPACVEQAAQIFDIMLRATEVGCAGSYPPDILAIWHEGRSTEGMAKIIAEQEVYAQSVGHRVCGFVHVGPAQVIGLFVDPDDHGKGFGSELFCFALGRIEERPVTVLASLNAVPFYEKHGCRCLGMETMRRHEA